MPWSYSFWFWLRFWPGISGEQLVINYQWKIITDDSSAKDHRSYGSIWNWNFFKGSFWSWTHRASQVFKKIQKIFVIENSFFINPNSIYGLCDNRRMKAEWRLYGKFSFQTNKIKRNDRIFIKKVGLLSDLLMVSFMVSNECFFEAKKPN